MSISSNIFRTFGFASQRSFLRKTNKHSAMMTFFAPNIQVLGIHHHLKPNFGHGYLLHLHDIQAGSPATFVCIDEFTKCTEFTKTPGAEDAAKLITHPNYHEVQKYNSFYVQTWHKHQLKSSNLENKYKSVYFSKRRDLNRLEITSDSVYSLRVQFQGQFRDFLFPFIMRIHPEADQTGIK